jgi:opacity protein-like surface antigen
VNRKASRAGRTLALLIAALAGPSRAGAAEVPKAELFAGYGYWWGGGDDPEFEETASLHGFQVSFAWSLGAHLGLVADASGHFGDLDGVELSRWSLLAGPRLSFRTGALGFFVHALAGAVRTRESLTVVDVTFSESATDFGGAAGGGVDLRLAERWALRAQGELTLLSLEDATVTNPRAAAGLVFRVGGR